MGLSTANEQLTSYSFHGNPPIKSSSLTCYIALWKCVALPETWESGHLVVEDLQAGYHTAERASTLLYYFEHQSSKHSGLCGLLSTLWYLVYYRPLQQKKWCSIVLSLWERGCDLPFQKAIWTTGSHVIEVAYITFAHSNSALLFRAHFAVMSPANQCQCNCSYGAAAIELSCLIFFSMTMPIQP